MEKDKLRVLIRFIKTFEGAMSLLIILFSAIALVCGAWWHLITMAVSIAFFYVLAKKYMESTNKD